MGSVPLVDEGDTICTVTDHFKRESPVVTPLFTGLVVGVLQNPVALPGHPLVHLVRMDDATVEEIVARWTGGEFEDLRPAAVRFLADGDRSGCR